MSSFDLVAVRGAVRFRGDYQNVLKFPDPDVNREIQATFGDFWRIVADVHQGWWDKLDTTKSTTANVAFIALPADCWRVQGVDIADGTDWVELRQVGVSDRNRFGGTATDKPEAYRLTARGVDLLPVPDTAYSLRFAYTPVPETLADGVAREWYTGWEEYVIEGTLFRLDKLAHRPHERGRDGGGRAALRRQRAPVAGAGVHPAPRVG